MFKYNLGFPVHCLGVWPSVTCKLLRQTYFICVAGMDALHIPCILYSQVVCCWIYNYIMYVCIPIYIYIINNNSRTWMRKKWDCYKKTKPIYYGMSIDFEAGYLAQFLRYVTFPKTMNILSFALVFFLNFKFKLKSGEVPWMHL